MATLKQLADYYQINYDGRIKKKDLVELVFHHQERFGEDMDGSGQPMSVRVRRINESSKGA